MLVLPLLFAPKKPVIGAKRISPVSFHDLKFWIRSEVSKTVSPRRELPAQRLDPLHVLAHKRLRLFRRVALRVDMEVGFRSVRENQDP